MSRGEEKSALRRRMSALRDAIDEAERRQASEAIARRVMALSAWGRARSRLLFRSVGSEVLTDRLIANTLKARAELILPRVKGPEEPMAFHVVRDLEQDLTPGFAGIQEPIADRCPERSIYDLDFVLVPGLAFDRRGGRLGYGGGYFDYVLNLRTDLVESGSVVAVAYSAQIVETVPLEGWDVEVPLIATENELIDLRKRSV